MQKTIATSNMLNARNNMEPNCKFKETESKTIQLPFISIFFASCCFDHYHLPDEKILKYSLTFILCRVKQRHKTTLLFCCLPPTLQIYVHA